jgi:hypothetical protein
MKSKVFRIFICLMILAVVSLACNALSKQPTSTPVPSDTPEPQFTDTPEPSPTPEVTLSDEVRVEDGGFAFRPIPEYSLETGYGAATMMPPGADPDLGPAIMLYGGVVSEGSTPQEVIDSMQGPDINVSETSPVFIGGFPGLKADISEPGRDMVGQVVVIIVSPSQQFVGLAGSPADSGTRLKSNSLPFSIPLPSLSRLLRIRSRLCKMASFASGQALPLPALLIPIQAGAPLRRWAPRMCPNAEIVPMPGLRMEQPPSNGSS